MKNAALLLLAAALFAACGAPPANNTPANTNTNTAPAVAAAPTADTLLALDKQANEAYFKGDAKFFETFLSDKFGWAENGKHKTKADVLKDIAGVKCDIKDGWKLEDPQMSKIDDNTYAFSYKGTFDGSCTYGGKTQKQPSPVRAGTVFVRSGDKWQAAWHGEVPMIEPKKDEKASTAKPSDTGKPADTKKDNAPKPADSKKEEPKKEDAAAARSKPLPASNTGAVGTAPPAEAAKPGPNTDALVKIELAGWQAWRDKNAKGLDDMAAKNLAVIGADGKWHGTRAETLKAWDGSTCENVKNVNVKNGFAWALSPTVEVLTYEASADGTCDGMKNGTFEGTSVYVKEGDTWKIAFSFMQPKGKM